MIPEDTIAAIATPLGSGGLGVIRVSGPAALSVADRLFRSSVPLSQVPSHTLHHGLLVDGEEPLDDAVAAVFRGPRSYTGEDVVELSCHGSPALLRRALAACLASGARIAGPGEFTRRAFLNGRMDLAQAEAVAALVAARSEEVRRWSLHQLRGGLSVRIKELRGRVLDALARLEAALDFSEDEVPEFTREDIVRTISALLGEVDALLSTADRGRLFREGLKAVLAGRPNTGKSSLFNALLDSDRAIVHESPGTTRDVLEESLTVEGLPVTLTDTAGLRAGTEPVEAEGVSRARKALEGADVALWVLDASKPLRPEDLRAADTVRKAIAVFNKMDLVRLGPSEKADLDRSARAAVPAVGRSVFVSARTGEGLDDLRKALASLPAAEGRDAAEGPTLIVDRHIVLVREASAALARCLRAAQAGEREECLAVDLRRALNALDQISGTDVSDDVLNAIFSKFCVGK
jgi:tRNA modification GTPase